LEKVRPTDNTSDQSESFKSVWHKI
jgi:hypothetical protein